jgi:hypothetical protein
LEGPKTEQKAGEEEGEEEDLCRNAGLAFSLEINP